MIVNKNKIKHTKSSHLVTGSFSWTAAVGTGSASRLFPNAAIVCPMTHPAPGTTESWCLVPILPEGLMGLFSPLSRAGKHKDECVSRHVSTGN